VRLTPTVAEVWRYGYGHWFEHRPFPAKNSIRKTLPAAFFGKLEHRFNIGPEVGVYAGSPAAEGIDCALPRSLARGVRPHRPAGSDLRVAVLRIENGPVPRQPGKLKLVYPLIAREQYPFQSDDQLILCFNWAIKDLVNVLALISLPNSATAISPGVA